MLAELCTEIKSEFPDFGLVPKSESGFMKAINAFLLAATFGQLNRFMTSYITTIGHTVYTPSGWDQMEEVSKVVVLRHERVHMRQQRRYGRLLFSFLYLLPFFPLFLAYWRRKFEMEAYEESMRAEVELRGTAVVFSSQYRDWMVSQFVGPQYGWMWPFKGAVTRWCMDTVEKVVNDYIQKEKK